MAKKGNFKLLKLDTIGEGEAARKVLVPIKSSRTLESTQDAINYIKDNGEITGNIMIVDLKEQVSVAVASKPQVTVEILGAPKAKKEPKAKKDKAPEAPPKVEEPAL